LSAAPSTQGLAINFDLYECPSLKARISVKQCHANKRRGEELEHKKPRDAEEIADKYAGTYRPCLTCPGVLALSERQSVSVTIPPRSPREKTYKPTKRSTMASMVAQKLVTTPPPEGWINLRDIQEKLGGDRRRKDIQASLLRRSKRCHEIRDEENGRLLEAWWHPDDVALFLRLRRASPAR
jgi:hypothetical protein